MTFSVSGNTIIDSSGRLTDIKVFDSYSEEIVSYNSGTSFTIDINTGTIQFITLTGNCVFTFPTPTAGKSFMLFLKQDTVGSRTITWPGTVKWPGGVAPSIIANPNRSSKYVFTADGTSWWGSLAGQNYL